MPVDHVDEVVAAAEALGEGTKEEIAAQMGSSFDAVMMVFKLAVQTDRIRRIRFDGGHAIYAAAPPA
ncbi:MAG: hypothetical protein ACOYD4_06555 [Solirubrobacterales bacterium]